MASRPSARDVVARGEQIFQTRIQPLVAGLRLDDFLAINILSGDYEVASVDTVAEDKLLARRPQGVLFVRRVGDTAAHFVGGGTRA